MFFGKYREISITYDNQHLTVQADGLLQGGTWENFLAESEINNPEDYSIGVYDTIKKLYPSIPIMVSPESLITTEGWHLGDED